MSKETKLIRMTKAVGGFAEGQEVILNAKGADLFIKRGLAVVISERSEVKAVEPQQTEKEPCKGCEDETPCEDCAKKVKAKKTKSDEQPKISTGKTSTANTGKGGSGKGKK